MKTQNPAPAKAGNGARNNASDTANLVPLTSKFNPPDLARRKRFLHLGTELFRRGQLPVAQFCQELADLEEADEVLRRLEDFTRISIAEYIAVGAEKFPSYLIPLNGGRR